MSKDIYETDRMLVTAFVGKEGFIKDGMHTNLKKRTRKEKENKKIKQGINYG